MSRLMIDSRHSTAAEKRSFLQTHKEAKVVMDFSTLDPNPFYAEFPNLVGSFTGQFTVGGRCELHLREEVPEVTMLLGARGITPVRTSMAGLGFTVARTLAMIVNEAYFAAEEQVATPADIDRAMRFGVNYPAGPFQWAKGREKVFVELLDALKASTGDERYCVAASLRNA